MPADVDSLAALGELASAPGRPAPGSTDDQVTVAVPVERSRRPRPSIPSMLASMPVLRSPSTVPALAAARALPRRTQLAALAVCSVAAGLLAGLVVPVASATPVPSAAAAAQAPTQNRTSARATQVAAPAAAKPAKAKPAKAKPAKAKPAKAKPAKATPAPTTAGTSASAVRTSTSTTASLAATLPALAAVSAVDWSTAPRLPATSRPARAATSAAAVREATPTRPTAATVAAARAYKPTRKLPADSGVGRRIVYSQHRGHVWVVGADGRVVRDYAVTGRIGRPAPGSYRVFSKSPTAVNPKAKVRFDLMVRFAHGITGAPIGFHTIPRWYDGRQIQREDQLGQMIGAGGCVRQSKADARWLYRWAEVGDRVVVLR